MYLYNENKCIKIKFMRINNILDERKIIKEYQEGLSLPDLAFKYSIGKLRLQEILKRHNIPIRKRGGQKKNFNFILDDWSIEKYPLEEGYHYIAKAKDSNFVTNDYMNNGGHLTSYIKKELGITIPTLYDRRKYYMQTGDYWWEQYFDIIKEKDKPVKKCPYCDWSTEDIDNKSGAFLVHLEKEHNISKIEYLKKHPEDKEYFTLSNKVADRQFSLNEDEYVTCAICGKKLARIDWRHLKKHNITKEEYIAKYGNNIVSKKLHNRLSEITKEMNMSLEFNRESRAEREIKEYVQSLGYETIKDRKILDGKEIDIYVPEKNIGIEYNGVVFHGEKFNKDKKYHVNKTNMSSYKGVNLIQIFEDEYLYRRESVLREIRNIFGVTTILPFNKNDYYWKSDFIKYEIIDEYTAKEFIEHNSILEFSHKTLNLALKNKDNKLVAVLSLSKGRKIKNTWFLKAFVCTEGVDSIEIGKQFFKSFCYYENPIIVETEIDLRWKYNSKELISMGFIQNGIENPRCKYSNGTVGRCYRFKKNERIKGIVYDKVWDCGYIKYIWKKPEE